MLNTTIVGLLQQNLMTNYPFNYLIFLGKMKGKRRKWL